MLTVRRSDDRGRGSHGWLEARHTFSFAEYYDAAHTNFGALRVINEDRVQPAAGFPTHGHRDMEIVTYILAGALEHKDSMGNGSVIRPGDVQRMSAGTGVRHSEYNPSSTEPVHLLQIWIVPERTGLPPSYEQKHFDAADLSQGLRLIASPTGEDGSVTVHQDARIYAAKMTGGESVTHRLVTGRRAYLQVARGSLVVNGEALIAGDGVVIEDETEISLVSPEAAEVLLFDLA